MIIYDGTKVFFHTMIYRDVIKMQEEWCAICNGKIRKGDAIYLIMNNCKLFPNTFVHEACAETKASCVKYLVKDYAEFEKFTDKYKAWINKVYAE